MRPPMLSRARRLPALAAAATLALTGVTALTPPALAAPIDDAGLDVEIVLDPDSAPKDVYDIGDTIGFLLKVRNTAGSTRAVTTTSSNLTAFEPCRWSGIKADETKTDCSTSRGFISHVVTAEDIAAGSFTPTVTLKVQTSYDGPVLAETGPISGPPIPVRASHFWSEGLTLDGESAASYTAGDTVSYTLALAGASPEHSYRILDSTFDSDAACSAADGGRVACTGLTHTMTERDADAQVWLPSVTIASFSGQEKIHEETIRGQALSVTGDYEQAGPSAHPDANADLAGDMTAPERLARQEGSLFYRIPAITVAPNGDILASYDERPRVATCWKGSGDDSPNPNSIVQRRSTDGGKTWGPQTDIHRGRPSLDCQQQEGYSDPSYIVDRQTGAIFNFHVKSFITAIHNKQIANRGNDPEDRHVMQVEVSQSLDNGRTWTHEVITPAVNPDQRDLWRFAASGQGIQTVHGPRPGRLVQQFTIFNDQGVQAVSVYSDDHGATWHRGSPIGAQMDENKVVELSDGTLMLNSRDGGGRGGRHVATSRDAGQTWEDLRYDRGLVDSRNNAQIIRAFPTADPSDPRAKVLLFSNAQGSRWNRTDRTHGTIWMSCDDGATWPFARVFREGNTSYSTIAVQADGLIGLLSEDNNRSEAIYYRSFPIGWVGGVCQTMTADAPAIEQGTTSTTVTVSIDNYVAPGAVGGSLTLSGLPDGWSAPEVVVEDAAEGPASASVTIAVPKDAKAGDYPVTATLTGKDGAPLASAEATIAVTPAVAPLHVERAAGQQNTTVLWGDWDGDGHATYAVRTFGRVVFYEANARDAVPVATVQIGRASDRVYVGDWDGDGAESLALVRGTTARLQTGFSSTATTRTTVPAGDLMVVRRGGSDVLVARR
ncbi:exo-alpha-sialidase [Actinomyces sp. B33]|uniref:exo-alpha-sialidase n=1 Tax=Actinomyces sp. B33 TaxID=2942131 RepID=UPI0023424D50|nr:exo-alpha-sialidase [Actinomyces sp. B33]MDC4232456.1 exo-alpha-sialidase [Actinomyces sp. B33]